MNQQLIFPMATYVFLMWIATVYMFRVRVRAIKTGQVAPRYYKVHLGEAPPESVVVVGRHYDNQFQVPMLFFITCLACLQLGVVNSLTVGLAWIFVISRIIHSVVMLGRNKIMQRVTVFAVGWITLLLMWVQLVYLVLIN